MEITCPGCGSKEGYLLGDGRRQCKDCRHKFTPGGRKRKLSETALSTIREGFWNMQPAEDIARECEINRKTVQKVYTEMRGQLVLFNRNQKEALRGEASGNGGGSLGSVSPGEDIRPLFYLVEKNNCVSVLWPNEFDEFRENLEEDNTSTLMVYQRNKVEGGWDPANVYRRLLSEGSGSNVCKECLQFIMEKMKSYRGVPTDRLQLYLEEMVFRFNCRDRVDAMRYLVPAGHQASGNH